MSFSAFPIPWLVMFPRRHFLLSVFKANSVPPVLTDSVPQLQIEPQTLTKNHGHLLRGSKYRWQECVISPCNLIHTVRREEKKKSAFL